MKISKSIKIVAGIALLAPVAMYASSPVDLAVLESIGQTVKAAIAGPIKYMLIGFETVSGIYMYSVTKNVAILAGIPVVVVATAIGLGAMG